jgi:hypothetical protein
MSASVSVFIKMPKSVDAVALDLQRLFGIVLLRVDERDLIRYEHQGVGYRMVLFTDHGLDDDMGIHFSRYNHQIDFDALVSDASFDSGEQLGRCVAMYVYEVIVAKLKCPAMVVYNLQEEIAAHG